MFVLSTLALLIRYGLASTPARSSNLTGGAEDPAEELAASISLARERTAGATVRTLYSAQMGKEKRSQGFSDYDTVVFWHGLCGLIAWQVLAPLGALIAAVGRSWGPVWFHLHWSIQLLLTFPLCVVTVVFGRLTSGLGGFPGVDLHKVLGYVLLALCFVQLCLGYQTHLAKQDARVAPDSARLRRRKRLLGIAHFTLGITVLTLGGLQCTKGLSEYTEKPVPFWVILLHWFLAAVPPAVFVVFVLWRGILRRRRGAGWFDAFVRHNIPKQLTSAYEADEDDNLTAKTTTLFAMDNRGAYAAPPEHGDPGERGEFAAEAQSQRASYKSGWTGYASRMSYEATLERQRSRPESEVPTSVAYSPPGALRPPPPPPDALASITEKSTPALNSTAQSLTTASSSSSAEARSELASAFTTPPLTRNISLDFPVMRNPSFAARTGISRAANATSPPPRPAPLERSQDTDASSIAPSVGEEEKESILDRSRGASIGPLSAATGDTGHWFSSRM